MILTGTNQSLELVTTSTSAVSYVVGWTDIDKSGAATAVTPGSNQGTVSSATETTFVAAPSSGVYRVITSMTLTVISPRRP